jgi:hypothetical protein
MVLLGIPVYGQSPADGPWSGSIQCDLNIQEPNYSRQETQTWTLTGQKLGPNGDIRIFEAMWKASGQGRSLLKGQGAQILATWTVSVPPTLAPLGFWVPPNEAFINFKQWHAQLRADNALTGTQQRNPNGVPQQAQPFSGAVFEWVLGLLNDGLLNANISGSRTVQVEHDSGPMGTTPIARSRDSAVCKYNFTRGNLPSNSKNDSSKCAQQDARIHQTFDAMKAAINTQFEALIQQTQDTAMIASLKAQQQDMLKQLEIQKQRDLNENAAGCNSSGSAAAGGSTAGGGGAGSGSLGGSPPGGGGPPAGDSRTPAPQLLSVVPASIDQGASNVQVTLTGRATNWQKNMTQLDLGPGITVTAGPFFTQTTEAVLIVAVADTAAPGPRQVAVTTNSEIVGLPAGLTIVAKQQISAVPADGLIKIPSLKSPGNPPSKTPTPPTAPLAGTGVVKTGKPQGLNIQPASGNYLVTITGLLCRIATHEDPLDRGGKGNKVYAATWIRRYDRRTGESQEETNAVTAVYGDTSHFPDRVQAGSMSLTGGINDGDFIPPNVRGDRGNTPPSDRMFPLKLWQGTLTDGADVLIFSPSIWEDAFDGSWFYLWGPAQNTLSASLLSRQEVQDQINNRAFGPLVLGATASASGNYSQAAEGVAVTAAFGVPVLSIPAKLLFGGGKDRPIGIVPNGFDATALPNTTIVLTREIIESALSGNLPPSPLPIIINKPGIMLINFQDTFRRGDWANLGMGQGLYISPGQYTMILQVERM